MLGNVLLHEKAQRNKSARCELSAKRAKAVEAGQPAGGVRPQATPQLLSRRCLWADSSSTQWPLLTVFCSRLWSLTGPKPTAPAAFTQPGSPHCFYQHQVSATQSLSPQNSDLSCTLFPLHYSTSILTACSDLLLLQRQKCLAVSCVKFSSRTQHTLSPIF